MTDARRDDAGRRLPSPPPNYGLPLLHRDRDFACIAAVTEQALQWYGPQAGK